MCPTRAREYLDRRGDTLDLKTYTWDGVSKDGQGDKIWNFTTVQVPALKDVGGTSEGEIQRSAFGQERTIDATFTVADEDVDAAAMMDDAVRPAEIVDADGIRFQVAGVGPAELGYRRLFATKMRNG